MQPTIPTMSRVPNSDTTSRPALKLDGDVVFLLDGVSALDGVSVLDGVSALGSIFVSMSDLSSFKPTNDIPLSSGGPEQLCEIEEDQASSTKSR